MAIYVDSNYYTPSDYVSTGITVDWATYTIHINKADMVLTQSFPTEIYQLDMDILRLALKDLEDDEIGMSFPTTHNHNPPVTVSGAVLARVVEILPPYTVTFEDGQYRVNVVGANTNIGERTNVNQVSVSTSNSAGLQDLNSLQAASFGGTVTIDVTSSFSGTAFPIGTGGNPVNNLADAYTIAESRGIKRFSIASSMSFSGGDFSEGYEFEGLNASAVTVTINPASEVSKCTFRNLTIQGTLDNANVLRECSIGNILNINGFIFQCALGGTITLGGNAQCTIMSCYSGVAGASTPIIDIGGSGQSLVLRDYSGGIKLTNKTGTDACSLDLQSGQVILDSTISAGEIIVRGVGKITNNTTGTATVIEEMLTSANLNKAAFIDGSVYLDSASSETGTNFPLGSVGRPVSSLADAITIANNEGLRKITVSGFFTATASHSLDGLNFIAGSGASDIMYLNGCSTVESSFENLILYGALGGLSRIKSCILGSNGLGNLTEVEGRVRDCIINHPSGLVQKTAGAGTLLDNCAFTAPNNPQITFDANGKSFGMRNCTGNILITNKTDSEPNQIHMSGAAVEVASSCTAGQFIFEGNGQLVDNSNGTIVENHMVNQEDVKNVQFMNESRDGFVSSFGNVFFVDPVNGNDSNLGTSPVVAFQTLSQAHTSAKDNNGDIIFIMSPGTSHVNVSENLVITKNNLSIRGHNKNVHIHPAVDTSPAITVSGNDVSFVNLGISDTLGTGSQDLVSVANCDNFKINNCRIENSRGVGVKLDTVAKVNICDTFIGYGISHGIEIIDAQDTNIVNCHLDANGGNNIEIPSVTTLGDTHEVLIRNNIIHEAGGYGVNIGTNVETTQILGNDFIFNTSGDVQDNGTTTYQGNSIVDQIWNEPIASHQNVGSTGEALGNVSAGASPSQIATAVWETDMSGTYASGTAGNIFKKIKLMYKILLS